MLPDIENYILQVFSAEHQERAKQLIGGAVIEDGSAASPRLQRSALVGSRGSIENLEYYVNLLKIDYRDVIVAGEYEGRGNKLLQVRDLNVPFSNASG